MPGVSLEWNGGRATWAARRVIADGYAEAGRILVYHIKADINEPYPPASLPGEPPHRRTGNLYRSMDYWLNRKTIQLYVGPSEDAPYGLYLEDGTHNADGSVRMEARPFMKPAYLEWQDRMEEIIGTFARRAFRSMKG